MAHRTSSRKRVVIAGSMSGEPAVAGALRHARATLMLIDRSNHLFQPLFYQVATFVPSPCQVGWAIHEVFRRQPNATVVPGEVTSGSRVAGVHE